MVQLELLGLWIERFGIQILQCVIGICHEDDPEFKNFCDASAKIWYKSECVMVDIHRISKNDVKSTAYDLSASPQSFGSCYIYAEDMAIWSSCPSLFSGVEAIQGAEI